MVMPEPVPCPRSADWAAQRPRVVAVVPAHNEQVGIGRVLRALAAQAVQPDRVVAVCDNCTDATAEIAAALGAEVIRTRGNTDRKAGALNQALAVLLPQLGERDHVLVQDADSALDTGFVRTAVAHVERGYGAVGGVFRGGPGGGFVGHLQRNEYARYARDIRRLDGKCLVVTGTAAVFRVGTLRAVSAGRLRGDLPAGDSRGGVYDTGVLTEDNELTFALLHLGHRVVSPAGCTLTTEVMPTWGALWRQRQRWKRGAVENCAQYGLTQVTWRYWARQLITMLGVLVSALYVATLAAMLLLDGFHIQALWLWLSLLFVVERVVTLRLRGWRYMLAAACMYELVLDYFLQACHATAYAQALLRTTRAW